MRARFVVTAANPISSKASCHGPIELAGRENGRCITLQSLKPSPLISTILFRKANRLAMGNTEEKRKQFPNYKKPHVKMGVLEGSREKKLSLKEIRKQSFRNLMNNLEEEFEIVIKSTL